MRSDGLRRGLAMGSGQQAAVKVVGLGAGRASRPAGLGGLSAPQGPGLGNGPTFESKTGAVESESCRSPARPRRHAVGGLSGGSALTPRAVRRGEVP